MIIVQVLGGLGNQMFQYAAARRLSVEKGVPLKLDISGFESYSLRKYKLHHFNIAAEIATPAEIAPFTDRGMVGKVTRALERSLLPRYRRRVYQERQPYLLEPDFLKTPPQVYLEGYFQNEKCFKPIEAQIRREFTIVTPPNAPNVELAERMRSVNAVSLHIRRGDYASDPATRAFHGLLPLSYYQAAAEQIASVVQAPHFFIFSDDPAWARENLQLDYPVTCLDHNDADHDYEDLRLLSLCQHHIIANSSFSWWGAWLCENPDKIIYAPSQWVKTPGMDNSEVVPPSWRRLEV